MKGKCVKVMLCRSVKCAGSRDNQIYLTFTVVMFAESNVCRCIQTKGKYSL